MADERDIAITIAIAICTAIGVGTAEIVDLVAAASTTETSFAGEAASSAAMVAAATLSLVGKEIEEKAAMIRQSLFLIRGSCASIGWTAAFILCTMLMTISMTPATTTTIALTVIGAQTRAIHKSQDAIIAAAKQSRATLISQSAMEAKE